MGNLTCSRHATYLHTIYAKSREIHILSTIYILGINIDSLSVTIGLRHFSTRAQVLARALI